MYSTELLDNRLSSVYDMSMAIAHFGFGASVTALVVLYLLPPTRYERVIVLLGGVWGMIPDAHWVSPIFQTEVYSLHNSVIADVFWLHRTLDVVDLQDSPRLGALMLGLFIGVSTVSEHWNYTQRNRSLGTEDSFVPLLRSLRLLSVLASLSGLVVGSLFVVYTLQLQTNRGLFLGIGAALLLTGIHGVTSDGAFTLQAERHWLQRAIRSGQFVLIIGGVIGGLTLLTSVLRYGVSSLSVSYAGLGALVLLQTTLLARNSVSGRDPTQSR